MTAETGSISLLFSNSIERPGQCVIRNRTYRGTVPRGRDGKVIIQVVLADETFRSRKPRESNPTNAPTQHVGAIQRRAVLSQAAKGYARFRFPGKRAYPVGGLSLSSSQAHPLTIAAHSAGTRAPSVLLEATPNDSVSALRKPSVRCPALTFPWLGCLGQVIGCPKHSAMHADRTIERRRRDLTCMWGAAQDGEGLEMVDSAVALSGLIKKTSRTSGPGSSSLWVLAATWAKVVIATCPCTVLSQLPPTSRLPSSQGSKGCQLQELY